MMKNRKGTGWVIAGGVVVLLVVGFLIFGGSDGEGKDTKAAGSSRTVQTKAAIGETRKTTGTIQETDAVSESDAKKAGGEAGKATTKTKATSGEAAKKKQDTGVQGVWEYNGNGFRELLTFGPNGSYGYLATPEDGNEQTITGKYEVSEIGHTVTIAANEEVEELVYERDGNKLKIWDRVYKKVRDAGTGYE